MNLDFDFKFLSEPGPVWWVRVLVPVSRGHDFGVVDGNYSPISLNISHLFTLCLLFLIHQECIESEDDFVTL